MKREERFALFSFFENLIEIVTIYGDFRRLIIDAHNTRRILDQAKQPTFYKLARYALVAPRTPLTILVHLRQLCNSRHQRDFWKTLEALFFPSADHIVVFVFV